MRFLKSFLFIAVIAILGFSSLNVQAQSFSDNEKTSRSEIERKVFKKILTMPYYGVFDNISFKVDGNTVTLFGKVRNAQNKSDAERSVEDIKGVRNVINNIEILPLSGFDDAIRYRIIQTFSRDGGSLYRYLQGVNPSVRIIVDGGQVSLEGYVATRGDYNLANILANGVSGVFNVDNNLIVEKERVR